MGDKDVQVAGKRRGMRYHSKLMLMTSVVILLPLLLAGALLFAQQRQVAREQLLLEELREMQQLSERLNLELTQIRMVTNLYYFDQDVIRMMKGEGEAEAMVHGYLSRYNSGFSELPFQVLLVGGDGRLFGSGQPAAGTPREEILRQPWLVEALENRGQVVWTASTFLDQLMAAEGESGIYAVRQINDFATWRSLGVMVIGVPQSHLQRGLRIYGGEDRQVLVLDGGGNRIAGGGADAGPDWGGLNSQVRLDGESGTRIASLEGREYLVGYYTIAQNRWKVVRVSDLRARLHGQGGFWQSGIWLLAGSMLLIFPCSYLLTRRFVAPVKALYRGMGKVGDGDFDVRVPPASQDEIGQLTQRFNSMTSQIQTLMADIMHKEEQKRLAELQSLQSQIHPHFLYNTLASVRYMVRMENKDAADEAIRTLIRLLRNTLSNRGDLIPLRQELDLLESYIRIQQLMGEPRFRVEYSIDPPAERCLVIKLLLQPLVENAILHGLKPKRAPGLLRVIARVRGDRLRVAIWDDGVGMALPPREGRGIGLANTQERIQLHFGPDCGMRIRSGGRGTTILIRLPRLEDREEPLFYGNFDR